MRLIARAIMFASVSVVGISAQGQTLDQDAAAFGAREAVASPDLSADGSTVLYLTPGPGPKTVAITSNLVTGKSATIVSSDGNPESLAGCHFVSTERLVCSFGGLVERAATGDLIGFNRLVALNTDGGDPKLLGKSDTFWNSRMRQYDGEIIDWLEGTDGTVLMSRDYVAEEGKIGTNIVQKKDGLGVDRLDTRSLRSSRIETPRDGAGMYMSDGHGNVRLMAIVGARGSGMLTGRMKYFYRTPGSQDWKPLADSEDGDFQPLAIDAGSNQLYALKKKAGRYALYTMKLDGSLDTSLVAENARVDIDDVVRFGSGQRVIGYTYAEEKRKTVYFDPEFRGLAVALSKALPHLPLVQFVDASPDGQKLLIFAGSDSDPGRYYLFDRTAKSLNEAMLARPNLDGRTLATVKSVTVPAADGVSIPAYLTLPPGREAKGLPAVILPHGGPSARDEWGFDWLAQFLAARGYAVLQPQYRGSAGFGDAWLNENGYRNWRTSIGDITASARWLSSQGIADSGKLAIVGWSYGGYAALQSAATEPSLYKAVVAIAPVTDLAQLKLDSRNFTNSLLRDRQIGSGPHVAEGSPIKNIASINAPVLLVHGEMDANVRYGHSQRMDAALRAAGKSSDFLSFKGLDHYLDDGTARTQMLTRIGALLERTIGK